MGGGGERRGESQQKARKFKNKDRAVLEPASSTWVSSAPASAPALKELKERASLSTWNFLLFVIVSFPLLTWVTTLY